MSTAEPIDRFVEKLNKRQDGGMYVIEEELLLEDGVYEGYLAHSNVRKGSVQCYTGKELTGRRVDNILLSTPGEAPWRTWVKVFASESPVYISYETPGDQVDAAHMNAVQSSIVRTQQDLQNYKASGVIDGGFFDI